MKIRFENAQESFGMAGPWLADCFLDNRILKDKFLVDNFAFSKDNNLLVLSRYSESPAHDRKFHIVIADFNAETYFISKIHYNALYVVSIDVDTIVFHRAFHDKNPNLRQTTRGFKDNFLLIKPEDLFLSKSSS